MYQLESASLGTFPSVCFSFATGTCAQGYIGWKIFRFVPIKIYRHTGIFLYIYILEIKI